MTTSPRTVMRIYFHLQDAELYERLLTVLEGITPRVQAHPADWSADVDLTGALRYWDRDPAGLAAVVRLRVLALYGIQSSAGVGPSRMIAAMAAAVTPHFGNWPKGRHLLTALMSRTGAVTAQERTEVCTSGAAPTSPESPVTTIR